MNSEREAYLWDNSGVPDPDLDHLQGLLISYRYNRPLEMQVAQRRQWRTWRWPALGLAAVTVVVLIAAAVVLPHARPSLWQPTSGWQVQALSGAPVVGGRSVLNAELPVGQTLQTGPTSSALVRVGHIGRVELRPNSALRLTRSSGGKYSVELLHGSLAATTWAPPFTFSVATSSTTVYDMGCSFTASVDNDGVGMVRVTSGWVSLDGGIRQQLIPAGAAAYLRPGQAPGTPFFEDSSREFQDSLQQLDFSVQDAAARRATLSTLLAAARPRDIYTLLRLMRRFGGEERARIVDRAWQLQPPPAGVTPEGAVSGDPAMLNRWYESLGLSNVKRWWVHWKDAF